MSSVSFSVCFSFQHDMDCYVNSFHLCVFQFSSGYGLICQQFPSVCFGFHQYMGCSCQQFVFLFFLFFFLCVSVFISIWTVHVNSFLFCVFQFSPLHGLFISTVSFSMCFSSHHGGWPAYLPSGIRLQLLPPLLRGPRFRVRHGPLPDWLELHARHHGNGAVCLLSLPVPVHRHAHP